MKRNATAREILQILRQHSGELTRQLAIVPLQLSMPTDGKGARIKVSTQRGQKPQLPEAIEFDLGGDTLRVPLEVRDDYQGYKLHTPLRKEHSRF
jgi:hypothetical protein